MDSSAQGCAINTRTAPSTAAEVPVPVTSYARLSDIEQIMDTIRRLTPEAHTDEQIAAVLNANGHRTPWLGQFNAGAVQHLRMSHQLLRFPRKSRRLRTTGYLTISQIADKLNVTVRAIYWRILDGQIDVKKSESSKC